MKVLPGQVYGSLYIVCIWVEFRRKTPEKRVMALCWCREYLTYGIVEASNLIKETTKSGRRFAYKKIPDDVLVDVDLGDLIREHSWRYCNGYLRNDRVGYMQNFIYSCFLDTDIPEGMIVDHINRSRRDNRVSNLRLSTRRQNGLNCDKGFLRKLFSTSKFKGVYLSKKANKWCSSFWDGQSSNHVGFFNSEEEAHAARVKYILDHASACDLPFLMETRQAYPRS